MTRTVPRVLVVDDDADVLASMLRLLRAMGFEAAGTRRHDEAPACVERHLPDLVLHDVGMPGLDIVAQARRLRAAAGERALRVVLFTGSTDAQAAASRSGADGVLAKPFEPDELRRLVAA